MKKVLKFLLYVILFILLIGAIGASYIGFSDIPTYPWQITEHLRTIQVPRDSQQVARGERIASMLCIKCHSGEGNKLVGKLVADVPKEFGVIHSYNITQDKEKGIGNWTDGEIIYFLKTGVRKNGTYAPPYMPKFPLMADQDIQAVVAWLRSDRPNVQAATTVQPKNQPNFLVKFLCRVAMKPLPCNEQIAVPDTSNPVVLGKYLSTALLGCFQCHSESFKTNNEVQPELSKGFFGGGNPLLDMEGNTVVSKNITPDPSGIGKMTEAQFVTLLKTGQRPDGSMIHYPMEPYPLLSDTEVKAIYAYLKTVPPLATKSK